MSTVMVTVVSCSFYYLGFAESRASRTPGVLAIRGLKWFINEACCLSYPGCHVDPPGVSTERCHARISDERGPGRAKDRAAGASRSRFRASSKIHGLPRERAAPRRVA